MPHAPGTGVADRAAGEPAGTAPDDVVARASALLATPGLVVLTGAPGAGRSTALRELAAAFRGPVFAGGGLAMLQDVPGAGPVPGCPGPAARPRHRPARRGRPVPGPVRAARRRRPAVGRPGHGRRRRGPRAHTRVVVALRTPHRLPADAVAALRSAATGWLAVPPLSPGRGRRPGPPGRTRPRRRRPRRGGPPRRRHSAGCRRPGPACHLRPARRGRPGTRDHRGAAGRGRRRRPEVDQVAYAVAEALADLTRPARTAMAALGLLGRPACPTLLGAGVDELLEAGLVITIPAPTGPPVAQASGGSGAGKPLALTAAASR